MSDDLSRQAHRIAWVAPCVSCCAPDGALRHGLLAALTAVADGQIDDLPAFLDALAGGITQAERRHWAGIE